MASIKWSGWGLACVCAGLSTSPTMAFALDPHREVQHYTLRSWKVQDGLPQNTIRKIVQTHDGYLWLDTSVGLARFNGVTFKSFDRALLPGLRARSLLVLAPARDGGLWVAGAGHIYHVKTSVRVAFKPGTDKAFMRALLEDADGTLWCAQQNQFGRLINGAIVPFGPRHVGDKVHAIYRDRAGRLWLATTVGLQRVDGDGFTPFRHAPGPPPKVFAIAEDRQGQLWLATDGGLIVVNAEREIRRYGVADGLPNLNNRRVLVDKDDVVWMTTSRGLMRFSDGKFALHSPATGFPDEDPRTIIEDKEGTLWIGTNGGGLVQLLDNSLPTLAGTLGLPTSSVVHDESKVVWAATVPGALIRVESGDRVTRFDGFAGRRIRAIFPDGDRGLLVGTAVGLFRYRDGKVSPVLEGQPFGVHALHRGRSGVAWAGLANGFARVDGESVKVFGERDGLRAQPIRAVHEDARGVLWLGGDSGCMRFANGRVESVNLEVEHADQAVRSFYEEADGTMWVATQGAGVVRISGGKQVAFGTREGLPTNDIYQILADDVRRLWLSWHGGIFGVAKGELDEIARGVRTSAAAVLFQSTFQRHGLVGSGGTQPAGWKGADGRLYFATRGMGIVVLDPSAVQATTHPPPVVIESLMVDSQPIDLALADEVVLPLGSRWIEFRFAALSFMDPQRNQYRYRLLGLNDDWREGGNFQMAQFTGLGPGRYTFEVRAANSSGVWQETSASVVFRVPPRFVQTIWFYALCAAAFMAMIAVLYRVRMRQVRAVYNAIAQERTRVARDLHDRLLQGMAAIAWQVDGAIDSLPQDPNGAKNQLRATQAMFADSLDEARRVVSGLRSIEQKDSDLATALATALPRLAVNRDTTIEFSLTGEPRPVPNLVESHFFYIATEAVHNALKHANAKRIEARLIFEDASLRLVVTDDGRGFSGPAPQGHFGLVGMNERAAEIGAKLIVTSHPGQGTTIEISVPFTTQPAKETSRDA